MLAVAGALPPVAGTPRPVARGLQPPRQALDAVAGEPARSIPVPGGAFENREELWRSLQRRGRPGEYAESARRMRVRGIGPRGFDATTPLGKFELPLEPLLQP